jgi:uncharacterized protein with von Willebrand factor type A (vWA) domain
MTSFRYSRWDGTQEIDPFTPEELLQHLADQMLDGRELWQAMRDMLQRGARLPSGRQIPGLRDLLERLKERRQQQLQRYNLDSAMEDIKEKLDQIIDKERQGIEQRLEQAGQEDVDQSFQLMLDTMAQRHLDQLNNLPPQTGGRIKQLRDYDFMDPEARQQFEDLLKELQQQVLDQYFQGMKQALGAMTPEQMGQIQQMVQDLNQLLEQHRRGDDSGFQDFMDKWGQFFPDGIENVDQLAQHLAQQMAAMQQLLDSMTPEMRNELDQMLAELFQNRELQMDLSELMENLDALYPIDHDDGMPFMGDEPITLQEALRLMGDMQGLEELERELMEAARSNDATQLNTDQIEHLLGEEARRMAEELQEFARMLEEAGLIRPHGNEWELTPRALRKIGERALQEIFGRIQASIAGDHQLAQNGWGVDRLEETKQYEYGDPFALDMHGTMMNALQRDGGGPPIRLTVDDFDIFRSISVNQCATVIMLDMSYSMLRRGRFIAGRKVAMALDSLIRNKFPRDILHVAAFSYFVLPLKPHQLLDTSWIDPRGTDFPEAIRCAREMLKEYKDGTKQIILITDGEPHANAWGYDYGRYESGWSMREAMEETLREVGRCTKQGITVNTFMLDTEPVITTFVKTLAKLNRGRIFFADPSQLGDYLIVDYMKNRQSRRG